MYVHFANYVCARVSPLCRPAQQLGGSIPPAAGRWPILSAKRAPLQKFKRCRTGKECDRPGDEGGFTHEAECRNRICMKQEQRYRVLESCPSTNNSRRCATLQVSLQPLLHVLFTSECRFLEFLVFFIITKSCKTWTAKLLQLHIDRCAPSNVMAL